jgi:hypothetical protein
MAPGTVAGQILAGTVPKHAWDDARFVGGDIKHLELHPAPDEQGIQAMLAGERHDVAAGRGSGELRGGQFGHRAGHRGLTIRRDLENHKLVAIACCDRAHAV